MVTPYEVILKQPIMKKCYANIAMQLKAKNFVWSGFPISITINKIMKNEMLQSTNFSYGGYGEMAQKVIERRQ